MALRWVSRNPTHKPGSLGIAGDTGRGGSCATFDGANNKVVLYNTAGETWTWNNTDWTQLSPTHSPSPTRYSSCMAYLPGTGVILFGGRQVADLTTDYAETWKWNGSDWSQLTPAHNPSARAFAAMTYSANVGKLILYGGGGLELDTWTYDGSDWVDVTPGTVKPNVTMINPVLVHDVNGDPRLIGATGGSSTKCWIWNGTTWVDNGVIASGAPTSTNENSQAGAYSPSLNRSVFVMRGEAPAGTQETWFETTTSYATNSGIAYPATLQTNVNQIIAQNLNGNVLWVYQDRTFPTVKDTFELQPPTRFSAQII